MGQCRLVHGSTRCTCNSQAQKSQHRKAINLKSQNSKNSQVSTTGLRHSLRLTVICLQKFFYASAQQAPLCAAHSDVSFSLFLRSVQNQCKNRRKLNHEIKKIRKQEPEFRPVRCPPRDTPRGCHEVRKGKAMPGRRKQEQLAMQLRGCVSIRVEIVSRFHREIS